MTDTSQSAREIAKNYLEIIYLLPVSWYADAVRTSGNPAPSPYDDPANAIKYVRADTVEAKDAEIERLKKAMANLAHEMGYMLRVNPKKRGGLYEQRLTEARQSPRRGESAMIDIQTPASSLSADTLVSELGELDRLWDDLRADDDGCAGSPGEWIIERMGEVKTELRRRGLAVPLRGEPAMKVNAIHLIRMGADALNKLDDGAAAYALHELANNLLLVMQGVATFEEWSAVYVAQNCQPLDLDKHLPVPAEENTHE
jgi:hypothetical protein